VRKPIIHHVPSIPYPRVEVILGFHSHSSKGTFFTASTSFSDKDFAYGEFPGRDIIGVLTGF
jgi:hypothetical protein